MSRNLPAAFATLLRRYGPAADEPVEEMARALFDGLEEGHVCVDCSGTGELRSMRALIHPGSPVVGKPGEFKPIILDNERLYLARYWQYEANVAQALKRLASPIEPAPSSDKLRECLNLLFPQLQADPGQVIATIGSVRQNLTVVSGGPGTGKTTAVTKMLALRLMLLPEGAHFMIKLAAPTGKAADRMRESIVDAKRRSGLPEAIKELIPEEASTIHRLLGIYGSDGIPKRNRKNPLGLDLLVLDEASMIDLSLMAKILDALPDHAGLILLGDKDQLDAVQPGRVFGDICRGGGHSASLRAIIRGMTGVDDPDHTGDVGPLSDSLFVLRKSYRFAAGLGIGEMASAVNRGDGDRAMEILGSDPSHEMSWKKLPDDQVAGWVQKPLLNWLEPYFEKVKSGAPEGECFEEFKKFRLITPLRKGPLGVEGLNAAIEQIVRRAHLADGEGEWYPGRPILITANDYSLNLFNGDVGITMRDGDGSLRVVFPGQGSVFRLFAPARLPAFEPAYAVTVHKSQGSEFESVLLLVPEPEAEVQNRNLLYTGITRARSRCEIWGTEEAIRSAIARTPSRASGLGERLR